jgi:hypothetical protein
MIFRYFRYIERTPDDDIVWATYIAITPEQDAEFSNVGRVLRLLVCGVLAIGFIAFFVARL